MKLKNQMCPELNAQAAILEQYKLYLEMADRISQRRMSANAFFIGVNTLLFTVTSFLDTATVLWKFVISALGGILCFVWYFTLNSYCQLNSGKYRVIHEIEKLLPLNCYAYEWEILGNGEKKNKYWSLSYIEKTVPIVFLFAYMAFFVVHILQLQR